jgi:hypothetical protein
LWCNEQNIAEGDRVVFTGYFYQFLGFSRFEPIIREGIIAMLPSEKMDTTLGKKGHIYLADLHTFGGNSGSPVMVNAGGFRNGFMSGDQYQLLGSSADITMSADFTLTVTTTVTWTVKANSGIAMIVPADELKTLLDSPSLQAVRDAQVQRKSQRINSGLSSPPRSVSLCASRPERSTT